MLLHIRPPMCPDGRHCWPVKLNRKLRFAGQLAAHSCPCAPHAARSTPSGQKQMRKLGQSPRLVVAADKESPELVEKLQKLSKSSDMPVILATDQASRDGAAGWAELGMKEAGGC